MARGFVTKKEGNMGGGGQDVIFRNMDLMSGFTQRRPVSASQAAGVTGLPADGRKYSRVVWDDIILVNNIPTLTSVVTPLGGLSSIVNCVSLSLQLSSQFLPAGSPPNLWPIVLFRDASVGRNGTTGAYSGFEIAVGDLWKIESDENEADGVIKFLVPKDYSIMAVFPTFLTPNVTVHIGYGVMSQ
jgi:hypothetical protein